MKTDWIKINVKDPFTAVNQMIHKDNSHKQALNFLLYICETLDFSNLCHIICILIQEKEQQSLKCTWSQTVHCKADIYLPSSLFQTSRE